ncbi:DUF6350 family protein [Spongisporangium articulatum]|uniref:DUF6350 family protein n=1 Tax=Spongisporangium articulatum TaxID=3362603 RepID=A0ABW8APD4_9ACTN
MSRLLERERDVARERSTPGVNPIGAGLLAAAQAAGASLTVVLLPVVLTWATAAYSEAPWSQALQVGVDAWLLAQHAGIVIPGGHVGLVPLALALVPLIACWLAGVRVARTLDPNGEAIRARVGRVGASLPPARALVAFVGGYVGLAAVACGIGSTTTVRPLAAQALVGAGVVSTVGALAGAAAWAERGRLDGVRLVLEWLRLPWLVRRCLAPAALAVGLQLGLGVVLVVVALVAGRDQVVLLHEALAPGLVGGLVLVLAQVTVLPNLTIYAVSYAAGPGFAIGADSVVSPGEVRLGALPAVPLLGGLPVDAVPVLVRVALVVLVALPGVAAGMSLHRRGYAADVREALAEAATTGVLVGLGWFVLSWLSGGAAGPGRLADVGPVPWAVGLTVGGATLVTILLTVLFRELVTSLAAEPTGPPTEPESTEAGS